MSRGRWGAAEGETEGEKKVARWAGERDVGLDSSTLRFMTWAKGRSTDWAIKVPFQNKILDSTFTADVPILVLLPYLLSLLLHAVIDHHPTSVLKSFLASVSAFEETPFKTGDMKHGFLKILLEYYFKE